MSEIRVAFRMTDHASDSALLFPARHQALEHAIPLLLQPPDDRAHPPRAVVLLDDRLMLIDDQPDRLEQRREMGDVVEWRGRWSGAEQAR